MSTEPTPMMAQYLAIKAEHPGALLFYRMGDFYEMFFDDAEVAASALGIALTKRGKHMGRDIAMCGVPVHAADGYLLTLIRAGHRVAVCEQMENPTQARKRGSKSVVRREVVRLVTPGTLTEDALLAARRHNHLAAWVEVRDDGALAWVDISTGELRVMPCTAARLTAELARLTPSEVVVPEQHDTSLADMIAEAGAVVTPLPRGSIDSEGGAARLCRAYGVASMDGFGAFGRAELAAMGALLAWLEITQRGALPHLRPPVRESAEAAMQIDAATRRNLELTRALSGGRRGSLIDVVDRTVTAAGARLLDRRMAAPARDPVAIAARLDAVTELVEQPVLRADLRGALRRVPDIDRALSRLSMDRAGPRDLAAIREGLGQAAAVAAMLGPRDTSAELAPDDLRGHDGLTALLRDALVAEPPNLVRDGGFIAAGHDADLDAARALRDEGRGVIAALQANYARQTGIGGLKIRHNNVLGYFVETTATHADRMRSAPLSATFMHRQSTASAVRFTTVALADLETRILNAGTHAQDIETRLFAMLRGAILDRADAIGRTAAALASIDVAAALADLAAGDNWCRPRVDHSHAFHVTGGRHPVVEHALRAQSGAAFVANDCTLSDDDSPAIWLLTGPNMAGKSTFLRQNAVIALLAQIGSYVPAASAHIGVVSQLFSRVGAADDLARGRSTFMVEMVETAAILNQADDRALVILDEIGRGTSTYDGLSIAWATFEHLHDVNRCRALFATHYHEMTTLADRLDRALNATVAVREWQGDVVFLHEVRRGAADRSYGVQVARLAGLPAPVIARARAVLDALERGSREGGAAPMALIDDLPLFSAAVQRQPLTAPASSPALQYLASVHPDDLTPKAALQLVYELKRLAADDPAGVTAQQRIL